MNSDRPSLGGPSLRVVIHPRSSADIPWRSLSSRRSALACLRVNFPNGLDRHNVAQLDRCALLRFPQQSKFQQGAASCALACTFLEVGQLPEGADCTLEQSLRRTAR